MQMIEFYDRMQDSNCILDLEVVTEERCTRDLAAMYPANAVRNRALMMTETDVRQTKHTHTLSPFGSLSLLLLPLLLIYRQI